MEKEKFRKCIIGKKSRRLNYLSPYIEVVKLDYVDILTASTNPCDSHSTCACDGINE